MAALKCSDSIREIQLEKLTEKHQEVPHFQAVLPKSGKYIDLSTAKHKRMHLIKDLMLVHTGCIAR